MDILQILNDTKGDICLEDLDFFVVELETGEGYSSDYKNRCYDRIQELRYWLSEKVPTVTHQSKPVVKKEETPHKIAEVKKEEGPVTEENVLGYIASSRHSINRRTVFKDIIQKYSSIVNESFFEKHYSFMEPEELVYLVELVELSEAFLDKYFDSLDKDAIAKHQLFSESFFMKHYNAFDPKIVLKSGKNEWRTKANRSKQLDVFLRLKGVKI